MNPLLEITSIRVKNIHMNPLMPTDQEGFPSINKAKAHSRKIGGAKHVRAFSSFEAAKPLIKEIQIASIKAQIAEAQATHSLEDLPELEAKLIKLQGSK